MHRSLRPGLTLLLLVVFPPTVSEAQQEGRPRLLSRDRELELALSAAPKAIAERAAVYVLGADGYQKAREGRNGFSCLVDRPTPASLAPTCYDPEGTRTILPRSLRVGELQMHGIGPDSIRAEIAEGFRTGRYRAPRRVGVAYMLSPETRIYDPVTERVEPVAPHVMIYAPYITSAEVGAATGRAGAAASPIHVTNEGQPNAYLVVYVKRGQPAAQTGL